MIPTRIRLLSLNCRDTSSPGEWIGGVITDRDPEVIAFQGVLGASVPEVNRAMEGYQRVGAGRRTEEDVIYSLLYVREGRYEPVSATRLIFDQRDEDMPRVGLVARLNRDGDRRGMVLSSVEFAPDSDRGRLSDISRLLTAFGKETVDFRRFPRILLGGFYEDTDGTVARILTGRRTHRGQTGGFRDVYRMANRTGTEDPTWVVAESGFEMRSDWIMVDGGAEAQEVGTVSVQGSGGYHRAILAELLL